MHLKTSSTWPPRRFATHAWLLGLLLLGGCATQRPSAQFDYQPPDQPEAASGYVEKSGWQTRKFAVAAANARRQATQRPATPNAPSGQVVSDAGPGFDIERFGKE